MNKLSKEYRALAEKNGFSLVRVRKHAVFKHRNGAMVVCPASPSDSRRGIKQFERDIKRALSEQ